MVSSRLDSKSAWWLVVLIVSILVIVSGGVLVIVSQLGDNFNVSLFDQMRSGQIPVATLVGLAMVLFPGLILLILVGRGGPVEQK